MFLLPLRTPPTLRRLLLPPSPSTLPPLRLLSTLPKAKETKEPATAAKEKEAARPAPGAGLPPALVEHLRTEGPYNRQPGLRRCPHRAPHRREEATPSPEWYAVTRGRFVGVLNHYALSDLAITGVGSGARKAYPTQGEALQAFNDALHWGIVSGGVGVASL
ncbi:hypothetical protein R3P38DRAFT_3232844 [Favolaschia claudopus]|uniref:Uncharacterized protein n=1 Tax=Favolaschia claudopus TaxID=2862362 RepID=A0AAV9ZJ19_9AGAR